MDDLLEKLRSKTVLLRAFGLMASFGLALLVGLLIVITLSAGFSITSYREREASVYAVFSIFLFEFLVLILRDQIRKDAESIYEEITDELQWSIQGQIGSESPSDLKRPHVQWRYALRAFAKNARLPLGLPTSSYLLLSVICFSIGAYTLIFNTPFPLK